MKWFIIYWRPQVNEGAENLHVAKALDNQHATIRGAGCADTWAFHVANMQRKRAQHVHLPFESASEEMMVIQLVEMCAKDAEEQVQKYCTALSWHTRLSATAPRLWRSWRYRKEINLPMTRAATDMKKDKSISQGSLLAREGCVWSLRLLRTPNPKPQGIHKNMFLQRN